MQMDAEAKDEQGGVFYDRSRALAGGVQVCRGTSDYLVMVAVNDYALALRIGSRGIKSRHAACMPNTSGLQIATSLLHQACTQSAKRKANALFREQVSVPDHCLCQAPMHLDECRNKNTNAIGDMQNQHQRIW
eukprot:1149731-Pelagomonas_calceolata.AAC.3